MTNVLKFYTTTLFMEVEHNVFIIFTQTSYKLCFFY